MNIASPRSARLSTGLALAAAALAATPASAELIFSDSFDYTLNDSIVGKNGGDWDGSRAWAEGGPSNGSIDAATVVGGLSLSDYATSGNALSVVSNHNGANGGDNYAEHSAARQLPGAASLASGGDLWVSYLVNHNENPNFANENFQSFADVAVSSASRIKTTTRTLFGGDDPDNIKVGANNSSGSDSTPVVLQDTTYLVVGNFTNVNGAAFTGGTQATMWIFDEAAYDDYKVGSLDESGLDTNTLARVTHSSGTDFAAQLDSGDFFRLSSLTGFGTNNRTVFDEVKLGTTLNDVVVVPEPASVALAAAGGVLLLRRRRSA